VSAAAHPEYLPRGYVARLIVSYSAWLANGALALLLIPLFRQSARAIAVAFLLGPWTLGAIDKFGMLVVVTVWLAGVLVSESALRGAAAAGWRALAVALFVTSGATAAALLCMVLVIRLLS
jgi:hypothetical protein